MIASQYIPFLFCVNTTSPPHILHFEGTPQYTFYTSFIHYNISVGIGTFTNLHTTFVFTIWAIWYEFLSLIESHTKSSLTEFYGTSSGEIVTFGKFNYKSI